MSLKETLNHFKSAGFEERPGQVEMMQNVQKAIKSNHIAIIEGGTGIGKSFGYLLPAIANKPTKAKIVISTATVNLQSQLLEKDLKALSQQVGLTFSAAIAKGRRRYVCLKQLHQDDTPLQDELQLNTASPTEEVILKKQAHQLHIKYTEKDWDGDKDTLDEAIDPKVWQRVTTDASGCTNRHCRFFRECAYYKARQRWQKADIIVCNHDLLLSDMKQGFDNTLPELGKCIFIIDEAHHFPQKTVEQFTLSSPLMQHLDWLNHLLKNSDKYREPFDLKEMQHQHLQTQITTLKNILQETRDRVSQDNPKPDDEFWLLSPIPECLSTQSQRILAPSMHILSTLNHILDLLTEKQSLNQSEDLSILISLVNYYVTRLENLVDTWQRFMSPNPEGHFPITRWLTRAQSGKQLRSYTGEDFFLHAAMTASAYTLNTHFWQKRERAVILCSATLKSLGNFDAFLKQLGLEQHEVKLYDYPSPFPYERSSLYIPPMKHLPQGGQAYDHREEVIELIPKLIDTQPFGTLVLFTSQEMMQSTFEAMPEDLKIDILMQDDRPKSAVIKAHCEQIRDRRRSILFGLQSFAEGVDLPGRYCFHVIITKIPFSVPNTPIEQTKNQYYQHQGKNAFMIHALPDAALRLTQFVGRLIRRPKDRGQVTILDRRLVEKQYGHLLLNNLPGFQVKIGVSDT